MTNLPNHWPDGGIAAPPAESEYNRSPSSANSAYSEPTSSVPLLCKAPISGSQDGACGESALSGPPHPCLKYTSLQYWRLEIGSMLIIFAWLIFCSVLSVHAQVLTTIRAKDAPEGFTLSDLGWAAFAERHDIDPNWFMNPVLALNCIIFMITVGLAPTLMFLRRVLFFWSTAMCLRFFTIQATLLPDPVGRCLPRVDWDLLYNSGPVKRFIERAVRHRLRTCADMIFSGHTTMGTITLIMCMSCHFWAAKQAALARARVKAATDGEHPPARRGMRRGKYQAPSLPFWASLPRWMPLLAALVFVPLWAGFLVVILTTRIHFSIDVIVAIVVTTFGVCVGGSLLRVLWTAYPPIWLYSDSHEDREAAVAAAVNAGVLLKEDGTRHAVWRTQIMPRVGRVAAFVLYGGSPAPACVRGLEAWPNSLLVPWPDRQGDIDSLVRTSSEISKVLSLHKSMQI